MIKLKRGLDLPIAGVPEQVVHEGPVVRSVALLTADYLGIEPELAVAAGERVSTGQTLFTDRRSPGVNYTAPGTGRVAIQQNERGELQALAIELETDEFVEFERYDEAGLTALSREQVQRNLLASGLWTALRTRPYSKVPAAGQAPSAIFVTAMDTEPLAARPDRIIEAQKPAFCAGLTALSHLTDGKVYVCKAPAVLVPVPNVGSIQVAEFGGPHPAGLAGTHIHFLEPVVDGRQVWSIGYQDVIAIGKLFTQGRLDVERIVALAGPQVIDPRLLRTRLGAHLAQLCEGELKDGDNRIVSGSVLNGRAAGYLGRYHQQVCVLREGRQRERLSWLSFGVSRFSVLPVYLSRVFGARRFPFTTNTHGSERVPMPLDSYERVMPLDLMPTQLLAALLAGDTARARALGALELDEEDLALCTYVCPAKRQYGPLLRSQLQRIEQEG